MTAKLLRWVGVAVLTAGALLAAALPFGSRGRALQPQASESRTADLAGAAA